MLGIIITLVFMFITLMVGYCVLMNNVEKIKNNPETGKVKEYRLHKVLLKFFRKFRKN
jgi:hypothetical protein